MRRIFAATCAAALALVPEITSAQGVHPRQYVRVYEVADSNAHPELLLGRSIDHRNNVLIQFDDDELRRAMIQTETKQVTIRVEASLQRENGVPRPIEVDNFVSFNNSTFVRHDKEVRLVDRTLRGMLPDSFVNLTRLGVSVGDRLYLEITDIEDQNGLSFVTSVGVFGLDHRVTDSLLLLRRLGTKELSAQGFREINFRPAQGMTFGWVYRARTNPVVRFLTPGFGYNVSFTDWGDSEFDATTGRFKTVGRQGSEVQVVAGFMLTLFDNTFHASYGWNLNAKWKRRYVGIGFSFFDLTQRVAD